MTSSRSDSSQRSRFVLVAGLVGAAIGGYWLALVLVMLTSPAATLLDVGALLIALSLLCYTARLVRDPGGGDLRLVALAAAAGGLIALL